MIRNLNIRPIAALLLLLIFGSSALAIDTAEKRRAAAHLNGAWMGPGVTPGAADTAAQRATIANNYYFDFPDPIIPSGNLLLRMLQEDFP